MARTILLAAMLILLAACAADDPATSDPALPPGATATQPSSPQPGSTPTATVPAVAGLPDGPLLHLEPADRTVITTRAALVRGTVASGAIVSVNGVASDTDATGEFFVAVVLAPGENVVTIDVRGSDGTRVQRRLTLIGASP